ncbi:hypothetical protein L0244_22800 [bacterium]|nr:hypothetical protein [bacterium]MCI0615823.1 hypothetical protein [bacterium]
MSKNESIACPLCQALFKHEDLKAHYMEESLELKNLTMEIIQVQHPGWVQEDGSCRQCWDYYRSLNEVIVTVD